MRSVSSGSIGSPTADDLGEIVLLVPDPDGDAEAKALLERFHIEPFELPIVLCDARSKESAKDVLIALVEHVLVTASEEPLSGIA